MIISLIVDNYQCVHLRFLFLLKRDIFLKSALCHDKTVKHTTIISAMVLIVDYVLSTVLSPLAQSSGALGQGHSGQGRIEV